MNITQLEKEILNAIKIEDKEIKLSLSHADDEGLKTLKKFIKKLFKEYRNEH
jgi:2-methylisocitrate lyase-like PEP mutase family enzyme